MWEYKRRDYKFRTFDELQEILNAKGQSNWEIVDYREENAKTSGEYLAKVLFKRLKKEPTCIPDQQ